MAFVPATATVPKPPAQAITALITAATGPTTPTTVAQPRHRGHPDRPRASRPRTTGSIRRNTK